MPTYTFDVTDKCNKFMQMSIKDMPGNPGQTVLINDLDYSGCRFIVTVVDERPIDFNISCDATVRLRSNHPEAIEQIIAEAEQQGELIARQAEIPGPFSLLAAAATGDWKIVGLDSEWAR